MKLIPSFQQFLSSILQHLTPLSHCRQHLPEIYKSSDTFVIHLIFQTTVKLSPDVQFAVFVENRIEQWLKLGGKPLLTAFLSGNASSFLPDHSRSAILSNKLPSNSLHTMKQKTCETQGEVPLVDFREIPFVAFLAQKVSQLYLDILDSGGRRILKSISKCNQI